MQIPRHIHNLFKDMLAAQERGEPIEIVEEVWISPKETLRRLSLNLNKQVRREQLKWLCDNNMIAKRPVDKKSFEYNPIDVERVADLLKNKKIKLPAANSFYQQQAA